MTRRIDGKPVTRRRVICADKPPFGHDYTYVDFVRGWNTKHEGKNTMEEIGTDAYAEAARELALARLWPDR